MHSVCVWGVVNKVPDLIRFFFLSLSPLLQVRRADSKLPTITFDSSPLFNDATAAVAVM